MEDQEMKQPATSTCHSCEGRKPEGEVEEGSPAAPAHPEPVEGKSGSKAPDPATDEEQSELEEAKARRSLLWRHLITLGMDVLLEMGIVFLKNLSRRKTGSIKKRAQRKSGTINKRRR